MTDLNEKPIKKRIVPIRNHLARYQRVPGGDPAGQQRQYQIADRD